MLFISSIFFMYVCVSVILYVMRWRLWRWVFRVRLGLSHLGYILHVAVGTAQAVVALTPIQSECEVGGGLGHATAKHCRLPHSHHDISRPGAVQRCAVGGVLSWDGERWWNNKIHSTDININLMLFESYVTWGGCGDLESSQQHQAEIRNHPPHHHRSFPPLLHSFFHSWLPIGFSAKLKQHNFISIDCENHISRITWVTV